MRSTTYVFTFVGIMTVVVALILSGLAIGLKPLHDKNEAIFKKKAILSAIQTELGDDIKADDLSDDEVFEYFNSIEQSVIDINGNVVAESDAEARGYKDGLAENVDMEKEKKRAAEDRYLPLYTYTKADGKKIYILSVRGNGLWDEIWANVAIRDDINTIVGVSFDHKGETPGLGAEIKDNTSWQRQFANKLLFDEDNNYQSIVVRKGEGRNIHEVDGISGATVTCNGVTAMFHEGIGNYLPYLEILNKS